MQTPLAAHNGALDLKCALSVSKWVLVLPLSTFLNYYMSRHLLTLFKHYENRYKWKQYAFCSFTVYGPNTWNDLPYDIRHFLFFKKKRLKTHLFFQWHSCSQIPVLSFCVCVCVCVCVCAGFCAIAIFLCLCECVCACAGFCNIAVFLFW